MFISFQDLIIEKLGLVKEVSRMKQLNVHLETRLEEQERRLCLVTAELSKTWHVVGRLRRHHHQLHTHEKILKYELQQKRKLLNELKEELEYCREKWIQAREKNTQSERDWRKLRAEFSSRKTKSGSPSFNNSAESGYSDERPSDESSESNDESEYVAEPLFRCKKKSTKSFENILDSSTDFNLAAEREDPPSDLLDVADLPLDTQDESHSDNLLKSDKMHEETEDEVGDINEETIIRTENNCCDTAPVTNNSKHGDKSEDNNIHNSNETPSCSVALIDPAEILRNIKLQNERLAKKDEKLDNLERCSAALLKKTQNTAKFSEQINSTLDHLINRPTSNEQVSKNNDYQIIREEGNGHGDLQLVNLESDNKNIREFDNEEMSQIDKICEENLSHTKNEPTPSSSCCYNENDIKDEALVSLAENDSNVKTTDEVVYNSEPIEPTTSGDIDHEARFAARDLRLKRLEEQTKSLVNKVNKTTTKGVKINYKLEELHNIYGSESSRAGTPSEENEDKSQKDDDSQDE